MKRTYVYCPESKCFINKATGEKDEHLNTPIEGKRFIIQTDAFSAKPYWDGETLVDSNAKARDYMAKNDLVPYDSALGVNWGSKHAKRDVKEALEKRETKRIKEHRASIKKDLVETGKRLEIL